MTSSLRLRAEMVLESDRDCRAQAISARTYRSSEGVAGSELYEWFTGGVGAQSHTVSERSAMTHDAVYACVGLIGGAIAALPFHLYKRTETGRDRYTSDLWWMFNESPWPTWTAASAWQHSAQSILLKGDGFWQIHRASRMSNNIVGFEPHHPDMVVVASDGMRNVYVTTDSDGAQHTIDQDDMLHFPGIGFDGARSLTPIRAALGRSAAVGLDAENHASAFFAGGAQPAYAIKVPADTKLSTEQRDMIRETWKNYRSKYSSGLPPLLSGGLEIAPLTLNAEDAQLLESRQYSVEQIARVFGVPPHMIGKTDSSTSWGSGIEQMSIGFVRYTLRRHLDAIQQEINRKIWPRSLRVFGEFNADALLDGDSKAQAEYFSRALGGPGTQGWMTIDEVRKLKNLPPVPGGDRLIMAGSTAAPGPDNAPT